MTREEYDRFYAEFKRECERADELHRRRQELEIKRLKAEIKRLEAE